MTQTTTAATWYAGTGATVVRRGDTLVLLAAEPLQAARGVWDALAPGTPVTAVLDALAALPGVSLTTLPEFAAVTVTADGGAHVLVRGRFQAVLGTGSGVEVVEAAGVTTWHERRVPDVTAVVLGDDPRAAADVVGDPAAWPLADGVAAAREVAWEVVAGGAGQREPAEPADRADLTGPAERASRAERPVSDAVPDVVSDDMPDAVPAPGAAGAGDDGDGVVGTLAAGDTIVAGPEEGADGEGHGGQTAAAEPGAEPGVEPAAEPGAQPEGATDGRAGASEQTQVGVPDVADDAYAHLWGATVMRTVEDAAVRVDDDEDDEEQDAPGAGVLGVLSVPLAATAGGIDAGVPAAGGTPHAAPEPSPAPAEPPPAPTQAGGLIAGIPRSWGSSAQASPAPVAPAPAEPAAVPGLAAVPDDEIDHDGHTIMSSELARLRSGVAGGQEPAPEPAPAQAVEGGPQVLARTCPQGHANPPSRDECRACGAPLASEAALTVRPVLGRMVVAGGPTLPLDRPVVVGRRPRTPRSSAGEMPRLVTVASPNQDVSRSHVEVRLEGWHVLATDLATTNGTVLHRGGQAPRRLHPGEATLVVDGDVVDLGDGATLTFEEIW